MLVLSRKQGERIVIGDHVEIAVVAIRGDQVRIGFQAPDDIAIHREEVYHRIREEAIKRTSNTVSSIKRVSAA